MNPAAIDIVSYLLDLAFMFTIWPVLVATLIGDPHAFFIDAECAYDWMIFILKQGHSVLCASRFPKSLNTVLSRCINSHHDTDEHHAHHDYQHHSNAHRCIGCDQFIGFGRLSSAIFRFNFGHVDLTVEQDFYRVL